MTESHENAVTAAAEVELEASIEQAAEPTGIHRNDELQRYEVSEDGLVAGVLWYSDEPGVRVFTRAEVEPRLQGQGIAGRLVQFALDEARALGRAVEPRCPYVRSWIADHPDYAELVHRAG